METGTELKEASKMPVPMLNSAQEREAAGPDYENLEKYFPFETMMGMQSQVIGQLKEHLLNPNIRCIVLEAPTGSGKSPIAMSCALASKSAYIVTANILLQDQYMRDFSKELKTLKGRSNYECDINPGYNCSSSPCQENEDTAGKCTNMNACGYHRAKDAATASTVTNFNAMAALTYFNYTDFFGPRELLIVDETHVLQSQVSNFVKVEFDRKTLLEYDIFKGRFPDYGDITHYEPLIDEIYEGCQQKLSNKTPGFGRASRDGTIKIVQQIDLFRKLTEDRGMANFVVEKVYEEERNSRTKYLNILRFSPVDVSRIVEDYLFKYSMGKVLLMSATILDFETFLAGCGIKREEAALMQIDSTFPKERRPIYTNMAVGSFNKGNIDGYLPTIVETTDKILDHYKDNKGIIHGHTYKICEYIYTNSKNRARLLYPKNSSSQKDTLKQHLESNDPTILLSPSMTEGVDLMGDAARVQIIVKTPYPYLGDPVIQKRMELYPNYYAMQTALALVQAYGRSIRSEDDWAASFFLDANTMTFIRRNRRIFPGWFLEAIIEV